MPRQPLPPTAAVVRFIDCINCGDLEGLGALMSADHRLVVLDERPLVGRDANIDAWNGYFSAFPDYVIYPRHIATAGANVAVLGTTTGSHLGLVDEDEMQLDVIWLAESSDGRLSLWLVAEDTPSLRESTGIPSTA
ncbi:MAG: nuclear transport factor 2 family protein [Acidimicrobiia bacterium]